MEQRHHIIIAIGANNSWRENKRNALTGLKALVEDCVFTSTVRSKDCKGGKTVYSNCLMDASTLLSEIELSKSLKDVEAACGDTPELRREGIVNMDIDLLLYDSKRLHEDEWERPYIKILLTELNITNEVNYEIYHSGGMPIRRHIQRDSSRI